MKTNILLLFVWMGLLTSCNSIDDVLKPSDDIFVSILETQDTVRVVPGDSISFRFMVTTNNGSVRRVEVLANDEIFEAYPEKMTFSLIDTSMVLTADEQGYLSRDVSSVIVNYPVYVKPTKAVLEDAIKVTFRATNAQGNVGENYVYFKGNNMRLSTTKLTIFQGWSDKAELNRFFMPADYKTCNERSFISTDSVLPNAEAIKEKIGLVFTLTRKGSGANIIYQHCMYSPNHPDLKDYLAGIQVNGYNPEEMKATRFYHIENVGGYELNDSIKNATDNTIKNNLMQQRKKMDLAYFDENVNADYLDQLDFSQAVDFTEIEGGLYAFETYDKRRGVMWLNYLSVFNAGTPITIERFIFQAIPEE